MARFLIGRAASELLGRFGFFFEQLGLAATGLAIWAICVARFGFHGLIAATFLFLTITTLLTIITKPGAQK